MITAVTDAKCAAEQVKLSEHDFVKVGVTDVDGLLRGKYMHRNKFLSALESGFGFCDVILGWDINDKLYDNVLQTGWHTGFPDTPVRIIPETGRQIPFEDGCWLFLGEFAEAATKICPRSVLSRVLARGQAMGFDVLAGFEYEFFVFDETRRSIVEKNYRDIIPVAPGNTGYSLLRQSNLYSLYTDIFTGMAGMGIALESLHEEMGAGVIEAALEADDALIAADKAALFKTFTKAIVQNHELMATFMAKWNMTEAGQSGHLHLSLTSDNGTSMAFYDQSAAQGIGTTMRHFIGGQQMRMAELTAMVAPTVNSYRRLIPGLWAPTDATWGIDNRTCAIRALPGTEKSQRIEYRVPGADANPYLVAAVAIASGLHGIENAIEPTNGIKGSAYDFTHPDHLHLPSNLSDAGARLAGSDMAREWFGDDFVDHYVASRDWEARQIPDASDDLPEEIATTELERYFELI